MHTLEGILRSYGDAEYFGRGRYPKPSNSVPFETVLELELARDKKEQQEGSEDHD